MDHTCCRLFCNFKCQIRHVHLQDNFFVVLFTKEYINFSYLNDLVLRYVLVILSGFEKNFQTTKSKLTNEKANYNEL